MAGLRKTKIEWADYVWNCVTGCRKISTGCLNCYSEGIAKRFWGERKFTDVQTHPERLEQPLKTKKGGSVFVNSMSDLFHEDVPNEFIAAVFGVMAACPQHKFIVLTKRAELMKKWFEWISNDENIDPVGTILSTANRIIGVKYARAKNKASATLNKELCWPLPNVILGVSVEDQATADERIPLLLQTPAACRMVSYEPAIAKVDFYYGPEEWGLLTDIGWLIAGAESGPNARPDNLDWYISVRDQCEKAGVAFFLKQATINGKLVKMPILDGKQHKEYPDAIQRLSI